MLTRFVSPIGLLRRHPPSAMLKYLLTFSRGFVSRFGGNLSVPGESLRFTLAFRGVFLPFPRLFFFGNSAGRSAVGSCVSTGATVPTAVEEAAFFFDTLRFRGLRSLPRDPLRFVAISARVCSSINRVRPSGVS